MDTHAEIFNTAVERMESKAAGLGAKQESMFAELLAKIRRAGCGQASRARENTRWIAAANSLVVILSGIIVPLACLTVAGEPQRVIGKLSGLPTGNSDLTPRSSGFEERGGAAAIRRRASG